MKTLVPFVVLVCLNVFAPGRVAANLKSPPDNTLRTKEFIVMGYQGIVGELTSSSGPYLRTLKELLRVDPAQASATEDQLRQLARTYPNIMDFADHVLALPSAGTALSSSTAIAPPVAALALAPLPDSPAIYTGNQLEPALRRLRQGMGITVFLKSGEKIEGHVSSYGSDKLWLRTPATKFFRLDTIRAIDAPGL